MSASITLNCSRAVVVISVDMARICGRCKRTASTNRSLGTLIPRSITRNPRALSSIATRVLPMSWMSPMTVPITIVPRYGTCRFARAISSSMIETALFIA